MPLHAKTVLSASEKKHRIFKSLKTVFPGVIIFGNVVESTVLKKAPHLCAINISQCPGAGSSAPQLYTISTALHEQYKSLRAWHLPALTNNQTLCISTFD